MQTLFDRRRNKILVGKDKACLSGRFQLVSRDSATHPEKPGEIDPCGCSGFGMERVRDIDPGANSSSLGHMGEKGQYNRRTPGAVRPNQLCDGSYRQTTSTSSSRDRIPVGVTGRTILGISGSAERMRCARAASTCDRIEAAVGIYIRLIFALKV